MNTTASDSLSPLLALPPNHVCIGGRLETLEALRYTPAGVPLLELTLEHQSQQVQTEHPRRVLLHLSAVAAGEIAKQLRTVPLGTTLSLEGFLCPKGRTGRSIVLQIQRFTFSDFTAQDLSLPPSPLIPLPLKRERGK